MRVSALTVVAVMTFLAGFARAEIASAGESSSDVATRIDALLREELPLAAEQSETPICDDATFLRRVTLDITGQLPTPGKVTSFSLDPDPAKREKLVEELLASREFGTNWGRYWRDVVMFRRNDERGLIAAGSLQAFLTKSLNENKPWDAVATELITASGDVRENGATGLIMAQQGRPEDTVAEISRIFLGVQIQCAQCHDHPTDRWSREQFHELAAFFPRVAVRPRNTDGARSFAVVVDEGPVFRRSNNNNRFRGTPEHYMPDLDDPQARGTRMQPVFFINDQKLPVGTRDAKRRDSLAEWITAEDNPWFATALVNRMWAELVGEGFYEPVDDLGPDRDGTAPKTVEYLAEQFAAHDYDVKWLFTTIAATQAYQRSIQPRRQANETPFAANCAQPLRADQLYEALSQALGMRELQTRGRGPYGGIGGPRTQFAQVFSYDPSDPRDEVEGSIPQALALMNSQQINALISASPYTPLGRLLRSTPDNEDVVVELYLRCLAREPSERETMTCLQYVKSTGDRNEAFEDVLWALINSTEFLYRK